MSRPSLFKNVKDRILCDVARIPIRFFCRDLGRAFQIGQGVWVGIRQAFEFGAGGQLESEGFQELGIVALQDSKESCDLAIVVIDDFGPWLPPPPQEDTAHADKGFDIGLMIMAVDDGADAFCQVAFTALPRRCWR